MNTNEKAIKLKQSLKGCKKGSLIEIPDDEFSKKSDTSYKKRSSFPIQIKKSRILFKCKLVVIPYNTGTQIVNLKKMFVRTFSPILKANMALQTIR